MTRTWLCPDLLFDGENLLAGQAVGVQSGIADTVLPLSDLSSTARRIPVKGTITPGFLDLQVNGGGDVFLNTDPTAAAMAAIATISIRHWVCATTF